MSIASHRRRAFTGALVGLAGLLVLAGCAGGNPNPVGSYERGIYFADRGKNIDAVGAFEAFVRKSPTDSLAADAQYRKAMAYMALKEYPLAAVEFQILQKDYPTSPLVEDALFQESRAYLAQVGRVERDMSGAIEARNHFLTFAQKYPSSPHMPEVEENLRRISDLMVRKRLAQVKVYYQLQHYQSVAVVLDQLLAEESDSSLIPKVMWERARIARRLKDPETAARMYHELIDRDDGGAYRDRAEAALRQLPGQGASGS